jgi:peptidoglycan-N-acetylglucosamine deacetylase
VALTFDDGPSPETTPRTLDLLDELGMGATFFVMGSKAEADADLLAEISRRGHGIGCHGFHHEHHLLRTPGWIRRDLESALESMGRVGFRPRWYRPPYGQLAAASLREARRHALEVVLWSSWGREWVEPDADAVLARLTRRLEPGAVILLHDNDVCCPPGTAAKTHRVLELLASVLDERGLRAVALDSLVPEAAAGPGAGE